MKLPIDFTGFPNETFELNEMQELVVPYIADKEDRNLIVAAPTASGKSTVPKMLGKYVLDDGLNVIYIGIMKALAEEKADDWSKDNWKDYPQATVTSDFRNDEGYEDRINNARIICITPESLASRLRRLTADPPRWLKSCGLLVVDECLAPSTLVDTDNGQIPIGKIVDENLDVKVASYNHVTGEVEYKRILAREKVLRNKKWYNIHYGKHTLLATGNHRVWVKDRGYTYAEELQPGDQLLINGFNHRRSEPNFRDVIGRWFTSSTQTSKVSKASPQPFGQADGLRYVEVSKIEATCGDTSENYQERRLGNIFNKLHNVVVSGVSRNTHVNSRQQETYCDRRMVGDDNASNSFGGLVHGRWIAFRRNVVNHIDRWVYRSRSRETSGLVAIEMGRGIQSVYNTGTTCIETNQSGKGQFSQSHTGFCDSRNGIQNSSENGTSSLQYVWEVISDRAKIVKYVKNVGQLWGSYVLGKTKTVTRAIEATKTSGWCCDLEVEGNSNFFANGVLVHNCHLLADGSRGANMEAAIIEFCHKFPQCRIVGLSATVPNVQEIANWITTLTGAPTDVVKSDFRPVPIVEEFLPYRPLTNMMDDVEKAKNDIILSLVNDAGKYQQQFLVAVFSKAYGRRLLEFLKAFNIAAEFHNADIGDRAKRKKIEDDFKAGRIRVLISTSTLFTGVNLPARNVIITALRAGPDPIPVYTLKQAAGRAGRPRYDTEGDVFYLCPVEEMAMQQLRIKNGEPIKSRLTIRTYLASHIVGAIHLNRITNQNEFDVWYAHTLAFEQGVKSVDQIQAIRSTVMDNLKKMGVVIITEQDGIEHYRLSRIGMITAQMYLDPYHFVSALGAIKRYSLLSNPTENDLVKAMCMWDGYSTNPPSYEEQKSLPKDLPLVPDQFKKIAGVIKLRITAQKVPGVLTSMNALVYNDISRMQQAISRAVQESKAIDISLDRLDMMFTRVTAQCTQEQAQLAVSKFTKKERDKLLAVGISTFSQAKGNVGLVRELLGDKRADALDITFGATKDSAGVLRFGKK